MSKNKDIVLIYVGEDTYVDLGKGYCLYIGLKENIDKLSARVLVLLIDLVVKEHQQKTLH